MSAFPELPAQHDGYDRHADAIRIVDPGACNPAGVALAIHNACKQVIGEGGNQREDAAIRLMTTQLAFLVRGDSDLDLAEYQHLMEVCRAGTAARQDPPGKEAIP